MGLPPEGIGPRSLTERTCPRRMGEPRDAAALPPVVIHRLDPGADKEKGRFKCTECAWEGVHVGKAARMHHAQRHHDGRPYRTVRKVPIRPRAVKQDPASVANRRYVQKHRAAKQVCAPPGGLGLDGQVTLYRVSLPCLSQEAYERAKRLST